MLKLAGAMLLLLGSAGMGVSAVRRLERRVTTLRTLINALEQMERELDFRLLPTQQMICEAARQSGEPASGFLHVCVQGLQQEMPLCDSWRQAALQELPALLPADLDVLLSLGAVLGRYDSEGQRQAIAATRSRLNIFLKDASEERNRRGRVYGTLGITAGAFLVLLFI